MPELSLRLQERQSAYTTTPAPIKAEICSGLCMSANQAVSHAGANQIQLAR